MTSAPTLAERDGVKHTQRRNTTTIHPTTNANTAVKSRHGRTTRATDQARRYGGATSV